MADSGTNVDGGLQRSNSHSDITQSSLTLHRVLQKVRTDRYGHALLSPNHLILFPLASCDPDMLIRAPWRKIQVARNFCLRIFREPMCPQSLQGVIKIPANLLAGVLYRDSGSGSDGCGDCARYDLNTPLPEPTITRLTTSS